jgi:hypothetical protein
MKNKIGADELCRKFPSGGGRKGAAGINNLAPADLFSFYEQFEMMYANN